MKIGKRFGKSWTWPKIDGELGKREWSRRKQGASINFDGMGSDPYSRQDRMEGVAIIG